MTSLFTDPEDIPVLSFRAGAGDVQVDLQMLLDSRMLVQGSSRSGKTTTLFALLQQTYGMVQHLIIDREADFVVLRQKYDYLVVGGEGDIPLDLKSYRGIETLIRKVLELRLNTIFDLSETSEDDRLIVVSRLCEELASIPRTSGLWHQLLFLIDELQHYAPEGGKSAATKSIGKLASVGGKRGYCVIGATQALAEVSKSAVRMLENKLILRTGAVDAERAAKELRMKTGDVVAELRALTPGVGYAYGPAISLDPVLVRISDDLDVYPPKRGERGAPPPPPADAIRALIAALPKATEEEERRAKSLDEANEIIADLQRQVRTASRSADAGGIDEAAIQAAVDSAIRDYQQLLREANADNQRAAESYNRRLQEIRELASREITVQEIPTPEYVPSRPPAKAADTSVPKTGSQKRKPSTPAPTAEPAPQQHTIAGIGGTPARLMAIMVALDKAGVKQPKRATVAAIAGIQANSGTYRNYLSELRTKQMIDDVDGGRIELTELGYVSADQSFKLPRKRDHHALWVSKVGGTPGRILQTLIDAHPRALSRKEVAAAVGVDAGSGTYRNYISELHVPGLVRKNGSDLVVVADMLFPEGVR